MAKIAAFNVRRCYFGHDTCRSTKQFVNSGQNLFLMTIGGTLPPNVNATINSAVYSWASEYQYTNQANIDKLNSYTGLLGKDIG